jgi:hypothetical protein
VKFSWNMGNFLLLQNLAKYLQIYIGISYGRLYLIHIEFFIKHIKLNHILSSKIDIPFAPRMFWEILQNFIKILQNFHQKLWQHFVWILPRPRPSFSRVPVECHSLRSINGAGTNCYGVYFLVWQAPCSNRESY